MLTMFLKEAKQNLCASSCSFSHVFYKTFALGVLGLLYLDGDLVAKF